MRKTTTVFPLMSVCQNEGQSEALTQPQSECASCHRANWWHDYSSVTDEHALLFMGKRRKISSAPHPPPARARGS